MRKLEIKENIPLAPHTFLKVGGTARFFCEVKSKEELAEAVRWAKVYPANAGLPIFVLGGGSNIVVADSGFPGLVIQNKITNLSAEPHGEFMRVVAGGGEDWDNFVDFAVSQNLAGVECLSGIPGTVGAAPIQNIGAYGQSAAETIEYVDALDLESGKELRLEKDACEFGYRTSKFKKNLGRYAIISVSFTLKPGGAPRLTYHELQNHFAKNLSPALSDVRNAVLEIRSRKGMVAKGEELHSSVGSFFTNPVLSAARLEDLKLKVTKCKETKNCCNDPWFWPKSDGMVKISAACLIECAGFEKGLRVWNTGISPLHSLAIINYGGASAAEILALADDIRQKVKEKFGVDLDIEPQLVGF